MLSSYFAARIAAIAHASISLSHKYPQLHSLLQLSFRACTRHSHPYPHPHPLPFASTRLSWMQWMLVDS
ncbi:hypothetical protein ACLKA6_010652 [Drosophila palustris]